MRPRLILFRLSVFVLVSGIWSAAEAQSITLQEGRPVLTWPAERNSQWPQYGDVSYIVRRSPCEPARIFPQPSGRPWCIGSGWSELYQGPLPVFSDATAAVNVPYVYFVDVYVAGFYLYRFHFQPVQIVNDAAPGAPQNLRLEVL